MTASVDSDALVGRILDGRYRVEARLGGGGMGVVYRARQLKVGRDVAIKLLRRERLGDEDAVARFLEEANVISHLRSPHTVTVHDVGEVDDGDFYIAMELLEGHTLRSRLAEGPVSFEEAVRILDPVALSLAEAHAQDIVHRDLKPANIFLARTPGHSAFAKVLDFGLAVLVGAEASLAGTPRYVAPELVSGGEPTPRADVYALGVLLVEMLTGQWPYEGETTKEMLRAHVEDDPRPLSVLAPDVVVPEAVDALIARCLAKPPRLRPADAGVFRTELRTAAGLVSSEALSDAEADGEDVGGDTKATLPSILSLSRLEAPQSATASSRRRTFVGAAVLLVVAGVAWRLRRDDGATAQKPETVTVVPSVPATEAPPSAAPSSPQPREASRPDMISVLVHTIPDGADVIIADKKRGETPMTIYLPKGQPAEIALRRTGYRDERVTLTPSEAGKLRRRLVPLRPKPRPKAPPSPTGVAEKMGRYLD